jgi:hypothetical protein
MQIIIFWLGVLWLLRLLWLGVWIYINLHNVVGAFCIIDMVTTPIHIILFDWYSISDFLEIWLLYLTLALGRVPCWKNWILPGSILLHWAWCIYNQIINYSFCMCNKNLFYSFSTIPDFFGFWNCWNTC